MVQRFRDVVRNLIDVVHDWFDNSFNQMIRSRLRIQVVQSNDSRNNPIMIGSIRSHNLMGGSGNQDSVWQSDAQGK